jgi:hypothetical protein
MISASTSAAGEIADLGESHLARIARPSGIAGVRHEITDGVSANIGNS